MSAEPQHSPQMGVVIAVTFWFAAGFTAGVAFTTSLWWLAAAIPLALLAGGGLAQEIDRYRRLS